MGERNHPISAEGILLEKEWQKRLIKESTRLSSRQTGFLDNYWCHGRGNPIQYFTCHIIVFVEVVDRMAHKIISTENKNLHLGSKSFGGSKHARKNIEA